MLFQFYYEFVIITVLLPLFGFFFLGLFNKFFSYRFVHIVAVSIMFIVTCCSFYIWFYQHTIGKGLDFTFYTWGRFKVIHFEIGFYIDRLSSIMMFVVSFVSFMVHIYTIGYMHGDSGYKRFFCYILFFTFSMLLLVSSNNVFQLFIGWECVGLASYLLIGFWFTKKTAVIANFKAFVINRIGDLGLLLGLVTLITCTGELKYVEIFHIFKDFFVDKSSIEIFSGVNFSIASVVCFFMFIGAMGKSAQIPLHVWLPDSMEGPTPISALIHAATMVTAGIFMVSRFSPVFEFSSSVILNMIMFIGSLTCLSMGILGVVQDDIKRIIAYSTLSQLGLMVAGLGASAYTFSMFHLINHAFFKALLFLGAGSVIISLHHEQSIFKMGNLRKHIPMTYVTMLIGSFALIGFPGLSGFFSKDLLIESIKHSNLYMSGVCYYMVLISVFFTSFYSFRLIFIVFHNTVFTTNNDEVTNESSFVIILPLCILSLLSICSGWYLINFFVKDYFYFNVFNIQFTLFTNHSVNLLKFVLNGFISITFLLTLAGLFFAWFFYIRVPNFILFMSKKMIFFYNILLNGYYFDLVNKFVFVNGVILISYVLWKYIDQIVIDRFLISGTARLMYKIGGIVRSLQTGYLYHYIGFMVVGLFFLLMTLFHFLQ